jgi:hypothetical protein
MDSPVGYVPQQTPQVQNDTTQLVMLTGMLLLQMAGLIMQFMSKVKKSKCCGGELDMHGSGEFKSPRPGV